MVFPLAAVLGSAPDPIVLTDQDGGILFLNLATSKLFSSPPRLQSDFYAALANSAKDTHQIQLYRDALAASDFQNHRGDLASSDGKVWDLLVSSLRLPDESTGFLWSFRDVTARQKQYNDMLHQKERLELGLLSTDDGIFDWNLITDEVHYSHNPGKPTSVDTSRNMHPDDRQRITEATQAHLKHGTPYDVEFRTMAPTGSYRWMRSRGNTLRRSDGTPYRFVGCYTDITARKQVQEQLEQAERNHRNVLSGIQEIVFGIDASGTCRYLNPSWSKQLGFPIPDCIGKPLSSFADPADQAHVIRYLLGPRQADQKPLECRWVNSTGEAKWFELRLGGETGSRTFGSLVDIEARRAIQRANDSARVTAERASIAKSEFVAMVSHELRTPLNAIIGATDLLSDATRVFDKASVLKLLQTNSRLLSRIIDDLLDISRIEAGRIDIAFVSFDLFDVLDQVLDSFRAEAAAKELSLELLVHAPVPRLWIGDPQRLLQVLSNLLGNALKFTLKGRVLLEVAASENGLLLTVDDTGVGISKADSIRIFEKFVRGQSAPGFAGSGLGLAISRNFVERMGGQLTLEKKPSRGSRFVVSLPLEPSLQNPPEATPYRSLHVALMTTDPSIAGTISSQLHGRAGQVEICSSAQALTRNLEQHRSNLVLCHSSFPKRILQSLVRAHSSLGVPFVLLSHPAAPLQIPGLLEFPLPFSLSQIDAIATQLSLPRTTGDQNAKRFSGSKMHLPALKILLVDDNEDTLRLNEALLHRGGYHVSFCRTGKEAVRLASQFKFDLILMDIEMPDKNGFQAAAAIRAHERRENDPCPSPIVALTGHAQPEYRRRAIRSGMLDLISKPVGAETLNQQVAKWADQKRVVLLVSASPTWLEQIQSLLKDLTDSRLLIATGRESASQVLAQRRVSMVIPDATIGADPEFVSQFTYNRAPRLLVVDHTRINVPFENGHFLRMPTDPDSLISAVDYATLSQADHSSLASVRKIPTTILSRIPVYLSNRIQDIHAAHSALDRQDFASIIRIAHNLKGSGSGYGFDEISAIGARMEVEARNESIANIVDCLHQLESELSRQGVLPTV